MSDDAGGDPSKKAVGTADLRNLQERFHSLLDQRNHYNDLAREAREARDLLNGQRREKSQEIEEHKKARDACNEKMREHKELRNAYQDQAKALIAQRKGKTEGVERSIPLQVRKIRNEVQALMERQETTVLTPAKEKELLDLMREKREELKRLEREMGRQKALTVDLSDTDQAIDELFRKADEEHAKVVEHQKEAGEHHRLFVAAVKEIRVTSAEADTKHQESLALRKKADEFHNKAMELREKVMAVREERRTEFQARRKELKDVNESARRNVMDPDALEKAKESALEELKKGGKIRLGF